MFFGTLYMVTFCVGFSYISVGIKKKEKKNYLKIDKNYQWYIFKFNIVIN